MIVVRYILHVYSTTIEQGGMGVNENKGNDCLLQIHTKPN